MTTKGTSRLPGLEGISQPPTIFFTMGDGENPKSEEIVSKLKWAFFETPAVSCKIFVDMIELTDYLKTGKLKPMDAVAIFDGSLGKRHMVSMPRLNGCWERFIKVWSPAFWNIMVSPAISRERTDKMVHLILVLYHQQYLERLDCRELPAGEPLSPGSHERQNSKRRDRYEQRVRSRENHLLGLAPINT